MTRILTQPTTGKRWYDLVAGREGLAALCTACFLATSITGAPAQEQTASKFDAATVLTLASIDAQTNIADFLSSDVPAPLRIAALRRAWTVDPAIRDFRGLQESDWDFNDPDSILGFGKLGPEVDVEKMVAQILGERTQVLASAPAHSRTLRAMLRLF